MDAARVGSVGLICHTQKRRTLPLGFGLLSHRSAERPTCPSPLAAGAGAVPPQDRARRRDCGLVLLAIARSILVGRPASLGRTLANTCNQTRKSTCSVFEGLSASIDFDVFRGSIGDVAGTTARRPKRAVDGPAHALALVVRASVRSSRNNARIPVHFD